MVEIRINVGPQQGGPRQMLSAEAILRYLITEDEKMDTTIMCKPANLQLITTDHNLYQALGSIKEYDEFKLNKLTKLLEVTDVIPYKQANRKEKPVLKDQRVEEIRKVALQNKQN